MVDGEGMSADVPALQLALFYRCDGEWMGEREGFGTYILVVMVLG